MFLSKIDHTINKLQVVYSLMSPKSCLKFSLKQREQLKNKLLPNSKNFHIMPAEFSKVINEGLS